MYPTTTSFDTYYTSFHTKGQTNISLPFIMANSCTTYDDIKYADKCKVDTTIGLDEDEYNLRVTMLGPEF
jgi:hypothetical protein